MNNKNMVDINKTKDYLLNTNIQALNGKFLSGHMDHRLKGFQFRLDHVIHCKDQIGLRVVVAEVNKNKKKVRQLEYHKEIGGWAPFKVRFGESDGAIKILNLANYEDKIAAKIQVDEEQVIFDF